MDLSIKKRLDELVPGRVTYEAPLAGMTTFGLGGPAKALIEPNTEKELSAVLELVRENKLPLFILGGGSNVLFRDGGFPGVVIRLGPGFAELTVLEHNGEGVRVEAGAAALTAKLVTLCRREGLSGLEFLAGIPGRVGGALAMNAGARGGEIGQALSSLIVMDAEGQVAEIGAERIKVSYRKLELTENTVILKGMFNLRASRSEKVKTEIRRILERRLAAQPRRVKSAGCVFKNPPNQAAGRLIDEAGLKGRTVGGAWVAREHANFIVHDGRANAGQIIELMEIVRKEVKDKFGVLLDPEIKIVGMNGEAD